MSQWSFGAGHPTAARVLLKSQSELAAAEWVAPDLEKISYRGVAGGRNDRTDKSVYDVLLL